MFKTLFYTVFNWFLTRRVMKLKRQALLNLIISCDNDEEEIEAVFKAVGAHVTRLSRGRTLITVPGSPTRLLITPDAYILNPGEKWFE